MANRKVLLVGWDGADWKVARPLIESGQMPQMSRVCQHGSYGSLQSLPPYLSPMLWNSMATGKRPHKHGILGFSQVNPLSGKVQPVSSRMRKCPALWNILSSQQINNHVIGWFASHPAEKIRGVCVSESFTRPPQKVGDDWRVPQQSVCPASSAASLAELRVRIEDVDQALLGLFLPHMDQMDLEQDLRWQKIIYRLAELYTAHNAAIQIISEHTDWRCLAVYYHFIDWICHDFMPYRPSVKTASSEQDVRFYGSVVDAAYRVQDALLADLLQHAGSEVTLMVVSDHGFHSDSLRPEKIPDVSAGIANWHRSHGIIAMSGPGIKPAGTISGANVLDVTPTVLHLLDLPIGADMDGRPLVEATLSANPAAKIPSWDTLALDPEATETDVCESEDDALLQQFIDLGYIEMPSNPHEDLVEMTERETAFNLGIDLLDANLPAEALPHLYLAHATAPEAVHYAFHFARALSLLGLREEANNALAVVDDFGDDNLQGQRLRAQIDYLNGDFAAAAAQLGELNNRSDAGSGLLNQQGLLALQQSDFKTAEAMFRQSIDSDADNADAWAGLARALLRRKQFPDAISAARHAISLKRDMPIALLTIGQAQEQLEQVDEAAMAYAQAFQLQPHLANTWNALLRLTPSCSETVQQQIHQLVNAHETTANPPACPKVDAAAIFESARESFAQRLATKRAAMQPVAAYTFSVASEPASSGQEFLIVSGLPRSGTSMLMQILAAGGIEPMTDSLRAPDTSNPEGYFEWEPIKRLAENPNIIEQAGQRAVKVVSALLSHLPRKHAYKVIFMRRNLLEVSRSQQAMLDRSPPNKHQASDITRLSEMLQQHEQQVLEQLRKRTEIDLLEIDYRQTLTQPEQTIRQLQSFVGCGRLTDTASMRTVIKPKLYRQRVES